MLVARDRLLYLKYPELNEGGYGSSVSRESRYSRLTTDKEATTVQDMLRILGNKDDDPWPIFSDKSSARVSTINLGERSLLLHRRGCISLGGLTLSGLNCQSTGRSGVLTCFFWGRGKDMK